MKCSKYIISLAHTIWNEKRRRESELFSLFRRQEKDVKVGEDTREDYKLFVCIVLVTLSDNDANMLFDLKNPRQKSRG